MKKTKLLGALASAAGLAAVAAPVACMTSCAQKSHFVVKGQSAEVGTSFLRFEVQCPSIKEGETLVSIVPAYAIIDGAILTEAEGSVFNTPVIPLSAPEAKEADVLFAKHELTDQEKNVKLVCFCVCISEKDGSVLWDQKLAIDFTVTSPAP